MSRSMVWLVLVALTAGLLLDVTGRVAGAQDVAAREASLAQLLVTKLGDDARTIRVIVAGKKVILTGQVVERSTGELAEEVAAFAGFKRVSNQLVAEKDMKLSGAKIGSETRDSALESSVKGALVGEIGKHAGKVEVEVCDGVVSLRGPVPDTARKELALKTAAAVKGVVRLVDLLTAMD